MAIRHSDAEWIGSLREGSGSLALGSGAFKGAYSFNSRFAEGTGTNPEELIAAAHAGCYSMALAASLGQAKLEPEHIHTQAKVHFSPIDGKPTITLIELVTEAKVPGLDDARFQEIAAETKQACPISRALAAVEIKLEAKLV